MNIVFSENINNAAYQKLIKKFYDAYAAKLLKYTRRHYGINEDDAMSLVYKTIYKMANVSDRYAFENEAKRASFVFKTHINYLRNYFRDNKSFESRNKEVELSETHLTAAEDAQAGTTPQLTILQRQLDRLEEWERILLLMRGQDMPYSEISKFIKRPEKHLKVYYARLKKELLRRVNEELQQFNIKNNDKESYFRKRAG